MTVPTMGDAFSKMTYHLRHAQEAAATLAHLYAANDSQHDARRWLAVSENFKKVIHQVTTIYLKKAN